MVTITINGKEIEMAKIKARLWTIITKFHEDNKNILLIDAVEKYCEIIGIAFGVTTDEVLDNLNIEDVIPTYNEVYSEVLNLLTSKLGKKNDAAAEQI